MVTRWNGVLIFSISFDPSGIIWDNLHVYIVNKVFKIDSFSYRVEIFWTPNHAVLAGVHFDSDRQWQIQILDEQIDQTLLAN